MNYRQSPRKVRLVTDLVKGKSVAQALAILSVMPRRAAHPLTELIKSAVANSGTGKDEGTRLIIKDITVNKGLVFKRFNPVSRGRAHPIKKRTSHISLTLGERAPTVAESTRKNAETKIASSSSRLLARQSLGAGGTPHASRLPS